MHKATFLVVDDDPIALEVARERLEQLGFDVTTRSQPLGTSSWILQNKPDFVLLDVMMPALTGGELAHVLKRRALGTGVILYSSKSRGELRNLVERTGALGSVSKGLDPESFAVEIQRLTNHPSGTSSTKAGGNK